MIHAHMHAMAAHTGAGTPQDTDLHRAVPPGAFKHVLLPSCV